MEFVDDEPGLTPEQLDEWIRVATNGPPSWAELSRALMAELDQLRAEQKELNARKLVLP